MNFRRAMSVLIFFSLPSRSDLQRIIHQKRIATKRHKIERSLGAREGCAVRDLTAWGRIRLPKPTHRYGRRKTMRLRATFGFIVLLALAINSFSQGFQGRLRGSVRDAAGAVVPGVEVMLTNEATSLSRTTLSNESGEYSFAALDPGSYRLHASLAGFKAVDQTGI